MDFKFLTNGDPYLANPDISVSHEFQHFNDVVKPGTRIRFRNDRHMYYFRCLAHNIALDKTWIDCIDAVTHQWHSYDIEKFKGVVKAKRSRRRKPMI